MPGCRYWLFKSEPKAYSYADLLSEPDHTAEWDGIRNYQVRNFLRDEMRVGEGVLFYHSNAKPLAVVGKAVVVREGYPDYTAWDPTSEHPDPKSTPDHPIWYMVDIKADGEFPHPVTLENLRQVPGLEKMVLLRRGSRLSIQPVTQQEWEIVIGLGMANSLSC